MKNILLFCLLISPFFVFAQASSVDFEKLAIQHLENHIDDWHLDHSDIADVVLVNRVFTKHNQVTSLYFNQLYHGIEIHGAVYNINILPSGKVLLANNRFYPQIAQRIKSSTSIYGSDEALRLVLNHFGLSAKATPELISQKGNQYRYDKDNFSQMDISSKLCYFDNQDEGDELILVWEIMFAPKNKNDVWVIRLDALSGEILEQKSMTLHCQFETGQYEYTPSNCAELTQEKQEAMVGPDGASYRVLPYNIESPAHGNRALLVNPAKLSASPFGWHDTNGVDGAEYTITRGNNVHAYTDLTNTNQSSNDEPNGGASLIFDYPFDANQEPANARQAAVTNLFYMNNFMHDFLFQYGFDENAGNFQKKNYYGPSYKANDYVEAEAQDGKETNNSDFFAGQDGSRGKMQMYIWTGLNKEYLQITNPSDIAGIYRTGTADFGAAISSTPISGDIIPIDDGSTPNPQHGCAQTLQNLSGKIALVKRGGCSYLQKATGAQTAGAKGLIIVNNLNRIDAMTTPAGSTGGDAINIPLVMIRNSDGALISEKLTNGETVSVSLIKGASSGPDSLDGDFDNGIIAHEYAHGLSIRLTGGSQDPFCLENKEQMGEGWSDFFTLAVMAKSSDTGAEPKGFGNYVKGENAVGAGLRRYPYSTDMAVNPVTYYHILNTKVHALGEVWTACLWDMYWLMVQKYGFDEDIYNGTGGNNKAIQLVIDGLKLQPCKPGFVDGRDAILAADLANNNGDNQCLIWDAFAKRGLGFSASQGDPNKINDGREAYDTPLACTQNLSVKKRMTPTINAGQNIDVELIISNYKGNTATGVNITDIIPDGTSYVAGSASMTANAQSGMISFGVGDLTNGTELSITYQLSTDANNHSVSFWSDDFETDDSKWSTKTVQGSNLWNWANSTTLGHYHSGQHSFYLTGALGLSDQSLFMSNSVDLVGTKPVLRFFQYYDTKAGEDGGIIEYTTNGGLSWLDAGDFVFRNQYTGAIDYNTFLTPNQKAYWGKSPDASKYVETMIDLSSLANQNFNMRFHFATGQDDTDDMSVVWSIDDVELMDMLNYNSEVCITSNEGDNFCAVASAKGTVVYSDQFVETEDLQDSSIDFKISPNPAGDFIRIQIQSDIAQSADISIINIAGKTMLSTPTTLRKEIQAVTLNTQLLPTGMYFVRILTMRGVSTRKLIIR